MNVYTYLGLELQDRGWYLSCGGESVYHRHNRIDKLLEIMPTGEISILNLDYEEIGIIEVGDLNVLNSL